MFYLPVPFSDAALQAVMVAGESLDPTDQMWFSTQISILERPYVGPDEEVPYRMQAVVEELVKVFNERANQYPSQQREWKVFGRMLLYIRALSKKDETLTTRYEQEFEADLAYYKAQRLPS